MMMVIALVGIIVARCSYRVGIVYYYLFEDLSVILMPCCWLHKGDGMVWYVMLLICCWLHVGDDLGRPSEQMHW